MTGFPDTLPTSSFLETFSPENLPGDVSVVMNSTREEAKAVLSEFVPISIDDLLNPQKLKEGDVILLTLGSKTTGGGKNIQRLRVVRPFLRMNKWTYVKLENPETWDIYKLYESWIHSPTEKAITLCIWDTGKAVIYYGYHGAMRNR